MAKVYRRKFIRRLMVKYLGWILYLGKKRIPAHVVDMYQHHDPKDLLQSKISITNQGILLLQSRAETSIITGVMEFQESEKSIMKVPADRIAIDFTYHNVIEHE